MARTKKASKKTGTKNGGKKAASRNLVKHPSRNHAKLANVTKVKHMKDRRGRLHVIEENLPSGLVAKPLLVQPKSKHRSYFEFVENTEKKKKLEFTVTNNREPPPGYEFVPIGNPELTAACKELSREQEAMIFIVSKYSSDKQNPGPDLGVALNRVGHHIRERIVEQARLSLGEMDATVQHASTDVPEPIPEDQEEINKQADAAIRDLFPRIPHTDRQIIIEHSFKKGAKAPDGMPLVGLAADLTLSRRVQLAVVSHIRHTHTRYDQLLRETTWANARRAVEELCLDILVKWRGDEENGRDQLDEILREVVVISDSEDDYEYDDDDEDDEDDDDDEDADVEDTDMTSGDSSDETDASTGDRLPVTENQASAPGGHRPHADHGATTARRLPYDEPTEAERVKAAAIRAQRGFQRYQAVRDQAWQQALSRQRQGHGHASESRRVATIRPATDRDTFQRPQEPRTYYQSYGAPEGAGLSRRHDTQSHQAQLFRVSPVLTAPKAGPSAYYSDKAQGYRTGVTDAEDDRNHGTMLGSRSELRLSPGLRTVVNRPAPEDLKDYLVPSIEPNSPLSSRFQAQSFHERQLDQNPQYWQSRPVLQPVHADSHQSLPQFPDEGFVRVYRQSGELGPSRPMPYESPRIGDQVPREDGMIRPDVPGRALYRPAAVSNSNYHPSHPYQSSRDNPIPTDSASSRQERRPFTSTPSHTADYGSAPNSRWQPAIGGEGPGGPSTISSRPAVVVDDRLIRGEPDHSRAAPGFAYGDVERFSDASRSTAVEHEHPYAHPYRATAVQFHVADHTATSRPVPVRQVVPGEQMGYEDRRVSEYVDLHAAPPRVDRPPQSEFIPVSNMFPRRHGPSSSRDDTRHYAQAYSGRVAPMAAFTAGPPGHGHHQGYPHDTRSPGANPYRQERVVRYEYVDHERTGEREMQHVNDRGELYRAPGPSGYPTAPGNHVAPPVRRPSRQDGVIYIE